MDEVERIYNEGKLLMRAMDQPTLKKGMYYECYTWVEEFYSLMNSELSSLSTTLVVPGVGVRNYKNIGFLINSDMAECFHIAKRDSGSCGDVINGDFHANKPDFNTIAELANYIKENSDIVMNEVNVNVKLEGVVGLFINKCMKSYYLLKKIYVAKRMIKYMTGIDYPIYLYDWNLGKLELIDLTKEQEDDLIFSLGSNQIYYWPDDLDEPEFIPIDFSQKSK